MRLTSHEMCVNLAQLYETYSNTVISGCTEEEVAGHFASEHTRLFHNNEITFEEAFRCAADVYESKNPLVITPYQDKLAWRFWSWIDRHQFKLAVAAFCFGLLSLIGLVAG